ncbi:MAG: MSMEG_4193 family putative phosphomutase [Nocardioides sp.]
MATLVLVRHGRTSANAAGVLAGRAAGVRLDEAGQEQARRVGRRLSGVTLAAAVTSPLERCRQTARLALASQPRALAPLVESGLTECDYGSWQGRPLKELARERLWRTVQATPSAVAFPEGETMAAMQARAVAAVRRHDVAVTGNHGPGTAWLAVSHGDVIKAILADALGLHLDLFQRIHVDPGSISLVRYSAGAPPTVLAVNTHEGDLYWLTRQHRRRRGAVVGGGAGPG